MFRLVFGVIGLFYYLRIVVILYGTAPEKGGGTLIVAPSISLAGPVVLISSKWAGQVPSQTSRMVGAAIRAATSSLV